LNIIPLTFVYNTSHPPTSLPLCLSYRPSSFIPFLPSTASPPQLFPPSLCIPSSPLPSVAPPPNLFPPSFCSLYSSSNCSFPLLPLLIIYSLLSLCRLSPLSYSLLLSASPSPSIRSLPLQPSSSYNFSFPLHPLFPPFICSPSSSSICSFPLQLLLVTYLSPSLSPLLLKYSFLNCSSPVFSPHLFSSSF
jgi:hypothetical protein